MMPTKELTNALLKGKMTDAMVDRGYCLDLDNVTLPGYYSVGDATLNRPGNIYGTMEYRVSSTFRSQVIRTLTGCIYQRVGQANNPIGGWRKQQLSPL